VIAGLLWLLGCQLVGEVLVRSADLPIPGPVVGMAVLFGVLQWRRPVAEAGVFVVGDTLLRHLQLFFVPAGVGVVVYLGMLRADALPISVALVGSWLVGLVVIGGLVSVLGRRSHG
jgi:holin-like protein